MDNNRKESIIIDKKSLSTSIWKLSILIAVTTFYRFLSIDIGNRYSSMIDIDYYRLLSIIGLSINYVWLIVIYLSEVNGKITF